LTNNTIHNKESSNDEPVAGAGAGAGAGADLSVTEDDSSVEIAMEGVAATTEPSEVKDFGFLRRSKNLAQSPVVHRRMRFDDENDYDSDDD
jgi:hypothetical protein